MQVRVPQLEVDGGRECGLAGTAEGVHSSGFASLRGDVDATGRELRQAETHQQRARRSGTRKPFIILYIHFHIVRFTIKP